MTDGIGDYSDWVGRERVSHDVLSLGRARELAATLDEDPGPLREGRALPPGWHWVYFHDPVPRSGLGEDGHERRGDFLPPVPLPRRMWAGGRLAFERPLRIGDEVRRVSTIRSITEKKGHAGPLVFVAVEHVLHDARGAALVEEQDLVYLARPVRESDPRTAPAGEVSTHGRGGADAHERHAAAPAVDAAAEVGRPPEWTSRFMADEPTLFRFSALTFNGHRIHYDRAYSVDVEGYPGLVVHGPLLALVLLGAGARWAGARQSAGPAVERRAFARGPEARVRDARVLARYEYRVLRPLFCRELVTFHGGVGSKDGSSGERLDLLGEHAERGVVIRASLTTRAQ